MNARRPPSAKRPRLSNASVLPTCTPSRALWIRGPFQRLKVSKEGGGRLYGMSAQSTALLYQMRHKG